MNPDQFREQSETWFSFLKGFVDGFIVPVGKMIAAFGQFLFDHPAWTIALLIGAVALALLIKYAWKVGLVVLGVVLLLGVGWGMLRGDQTESLSNLFGSNANDDVFNVSEAVYDRLFYGGVGLTTEEPSKNFHELAREFSRLIGQTEPASASGGDGCSPSYFPAENDSFEIGLRKMQKLALWCDHEELFVFIKTKQSLFNSGHQWVRISLASNEISVVPDFEKLGNFLQSLAKDAIQHIAIVHNHPTAILHGHYIPVPPSLGDLEVLRLSTGLKVAGLLAALSISGAALPNPRRLAEFASRQMMIAVDARGAWVASFEPSWAENFLKEVNRAAGSPEDHEKFMGAWLSSLSKAKQTTQEPIVLPEGGTADNNKDTNKDKEMEDAQQILRELTKIIKQETLYREIKRISQEVAELRLKRAMFLCHDATVCEAIYKNGLRDWLFLGSEMAVLDSILSVALQRLRQLYPAGMNAEVAALLQHAIVNLQVRRRVINDFGGIKLRYLEFGEVL